MWRTFGLIILFGLLVVSVAGNVVFLQEARSSSAEADHLRQRALTAEQQQNALQQRLAQAAGSQEPSPAAARSTQAPAVPAPSAASPTLATIETQVAALRGLQPKSDVQLKFLDQDDLRQYLVDNFNRDYLPTERESDQKLETMLGLLGPNDNLVQLLLQVLQEQVIGIYSADDKTMYLVGDQTQIDASEKSTFAHEYTHALQDQYFDLTTLSPKHPDNDDRAAAAQAIIEGDAVLTQRMWSRDNLSADEINALSQGAPDSSLLSAPLIVREQLLFPYTQGYAFVLQTYQARGGSSGVDDVFRTPPDSTAQILHPEKYAAHVRPVDVTLPDLAASMGDGWRQVGSNVLGEFELQVATEQFTDHARAVQGTSGWAGDRWQVLEKDGRDALVLQTTWDSETAAKAFFDMYGLALANRFGGAHQEAMTDSRQALTAATDATELRVTGKDVLVVISFDRPTAEALATAAGG
ncbi:MAG: hypothetical protein JO023_11740 [Chloroflexi bacterium]|nr:hypothetical protein [Chloroflexota bacterium]